MKGQFEFKFEPFGISNSPAVFCRFIHSIFRDLKDKETVVTYVDDLIIPSIDEKERLLKLKEVLTVAADAGLQIKWRKCNFLKRKVNFLGYIIENSAIHPSAEKTRAVKAFKPPRDKKAIQQFLGLTSSFADSFEKMRLWPSRYQICEMIKILSGRKNRHLLSSNFFAITISSFRIV